MSKNKPPCWTCQHGLCVKMESGEVLEGGIIQEPVEEWKDEDPENVLKTEIVKHDYMTYCYWVPAGGLVKPADGFPAEIFDVLECSQHKEKSSSP